MKHHLRSNVFRFSTLLFGLWSCAALAQSEPTFTQEQAREGRTAYREHCASCHGARLEGLHLSPSLMGMRFDQMWRGQSAGLLAHHLRRMPPEPLGTPGSLSDETYANILAYILMTNGFEAGDTPLPASMDALDSITIPRKPGQKVDLLAPQSLTPEQEQLLKNLPPVTNETRIDPSPNDWPQFGRAYDGYSFSPLATINKENVGDLALAWRRPLNPGPNFPSPIVHQGVMYMHTFPDTVIAMDATNGAILWRYARGKSPDQRLGLGLHKDRVIMAASDMHIVALNARTGEPEWEHKIEVEGSQGMRGFRLRSAPLIVGDMLLQGVVASFAPGGGFITGIDLNTGEEVWRFYTIARPGEPFGNTWNDLPVEARSGGSVWHQGTYDPELNLVYFGVAPTYDTGPLLKSIGKEGVTNDALYTNCTIALNPETGELVWHYQHLANDQWDLDWAFERQIAEFPVNGKMRKVVMNTGKIAMLDALDAATGEYLFSIDAGVQNFILDVDPETGEKTTDPEKLPDPERPCVICPSAHGSRSWPATSYSPQTKMVYLPLNEFCMRFGKEGMKLLTSGVGITVADFPDSDGTLGRLQAVDVVNGKMGWSYDSETPLTSSVLATAGGLVFVGDANPSIKAFDDVTGELLWEEALDNNPSANLMTYSVNDTQYLAVVVGASNLHLSGLMEAYAAYGPEDAEPNVRGGTALWVFALN